MVKKLTSLRENLPLWNENKRNLANREATADVNDNVLGLSAKTSTVGLKTELLSLSTEIYFGVMVK